MAAEQSQQVIDQLNYQKKMSDLDYQIKIAHVKKVNETAKQKEKMESSGLLSYMNTPNGGQYPRIDSNS